MEQLDILRNLRKLVYNQYLCLLMLHKSFKGLLIQLELSFVVFSFLLYGNQLFVRFPFALVFIAGHIMPVVFSKAKPTEFIFASSALHALATLILLDARFTFWALLCICFDPNQTFGIAVFLFNPSQHLSTT